VDKNKIAIALSGGGTRAIAYHSGFLNYLAEIGQLEQVNKISSVSGGSLLIGLIFKETKYKWPSSKLYRDSTFKQIKSQLTTTNLQWQLFITLCNPLNWQYWLSRANVLSMVLTRCWGIKDNLSSLPKTPQWSINATTLENGCRFRFKDGSCGDYSLGYAKSTHVSLANAMAISAAIPGGIGPLVVKSADFNWLKKVQWYGEKGSEVEVKLPFKKLHLSDGGVYDNLGIEPFFDSGKTQSKVKGHNLYVLDAGSPLVDKSNGSKFNPLRLKRIIDITMEQSRALRVRSFLHYLISGEGDGGYSVIGQHVQRLLPKQDLNLAKWLSVKSVAQVESYPTNLKRMSEKDFDLISRHGYESAKALHIKSKLD